MPPTFDPQTFFEKTAYYPSAARGEFVLTHVPPVLTENVPDHLYDSIRLGVALLTSGMMAFNFTIPPQTLQTSDGFNYTGPTRKIPSNIVYSDVEVQFYLMGSTRLEAGALYNTFNFWHEHIAGYRKMHSTARYEGVTHTDTFFTLEYYDNYIGEAEIRLNHQSNPNEPITRFHYYEVYPLNIGSTQSDWSNQDQPMVLPITFTYHYVNSLDAGFSSSTTV